MHCLIGDLDPFLELPRAQFELFADSRVLECEALGRRLDAVPAEVRMLAQFHGNGYALRFSKRVSNVGVPRPISARMLVRH